MHIRKNFLPPPFLVQKELPLQEKQKAFVERSRLQCKEIIEGKSPLFVIIAGPCSIHDEASAIEYALELKGLAKEVKSSLFLVMRLFFEKPRTQLGWKGILYDPDLDGSHDIAKGIEQTRKLLLKMADLEVPCASELLDPLAAEYFSDLISWGFVGARTSASPLHRQMASGLPFPVGFKNTLHGEIDVAASAVLAAKTAHAYLGMDQEGKICQINTSGNPWTHVVLRGSQTKPNFDGVSIKKTVKILKQHHLPSRILIDCAHGNSGKTPELQKIAFQSVIAQAKEENSPLFGAMLESHLVGGKQPFASPLKKLRYGVSITDPCLGWEETEKLVRMAAYELSLCSSMSSLQK